MFKYLFILFSSVTFSLTNSFAQSFVVSAKIKNAPSFKAYLLSVRGDSYAVSDSSLADKTGSFYFVMREYYLTGIYKIAFSRFPDTKGRDITILYDRENIEIATLYGSPIDSVKVIHSAYNTLYYNFLVLQNRVNMQMMALSDLNVIFPKGDSFYPFMGKRFNELLHEKKAFIEKVEKTYPESFLLSVIKSVSMPTLPFELPKAERNNYFREHYLENICFNDNNLLATDIFINSAYFYLKIYSQQSGDENVLQAYIKATDKLMQACSKNSLAKIQVAEYLMKGFEQMEMDSALSYLFDHYMNTETCENTQLQNRVKVRLDGNKNLYVGVKAPEIEMFDTDSNKIVLSSIKNSYTLVLFWSSQCPHCLSMLPVIKKMYDNQLSGKLEILAISLDTSPVDLFNAVNFGGYKWFSCSDYKGWNSKTIKEYYVYATPTMYLLDNEKKIIAKPREINELVLTLIKLRIIPETPPK